MYIIPIKLIYCMIFIDSFGELYIVLYAFYELYTCSALMKFHNKYAMWKQCLIILVKFLSIHFFSLHKINS